MVDKNDPNFCSPARHDDYCHYLAKLHDEFLEIWNKPHTSRGSLDDFEKLKVIGTGAFGTVFLTKHLGTGKYYAMKMLEKDKIIKSKQLTHSFSEKKILCSINFPFVVNMKYFYLDNVYIYFILPFVAGGDMFTHLRAAGKFKESQSKFYAAQVLLGLEYLHACDLVYRDLKPENLLIDETGYVKLTDFGFCKLITGRTWTLCGTPEYLAPEVILSKGYGFTADWWSYGVLLYEMSAGFPPFYGRDSMKTYEKIVAGKYKCPSHFTSELKDLLSHTLKVDITRRFGNLKNGTLDFKGHRWFKEIDWEGVLLGRVPAPLIPKVVSPDDTRNFEFFEDVKIKTSPECLYEKEFKDF